MGEGRAVLREVDQRHERAPTACVRSGQPTDGAVRVRATALGHAAGWEATAGTTLTWLVARLLRRPTTTVVLPVSPNVWRRWRHRLGRAVAVTAGGIGLVVAGAAGGQGGLVVLGVLLAGLGWWLRRRAWVETWVGLAFRPDTGDIIVTRVDPAFGDEARRLYISSIRRHP
jgi:hypothetical protein